MQFADHTGILQKPQNSKPPQQSLQATPWRRPETWQSENPEEIAESSHTKIRVSRARIHQEDQHFRQQ